MRCEEGLEEGGVAEGEESSHEESQVVQLQGRVGERHSLRGCEW